MVDREAAEIESIRPDTLRDMSTQVNMKGGAIGVVVDGGEAFGDSIHSLVASDVGMTSDPVQFHFDQRGE